ncbi:ubiquinol oxidase 4, chloroplastic/chromoplastic, partial [Tanacetum coccineum]
MRLETSPSSSYSRLALSLARSLLEYPRFCKVEATVVRENEKKVIAEETFQPKTSPGDENGGPNSEPPNGEPSSSLEKWTIKLEQSINIFLTDSVIKVIDALYHDRDYP